MLQSVFLCTCAAVQAMLSDATSPFVYYYPDPEELHLVYVHFPLPTDAHLAHGDKITLLLGVECASAVYCWCSTMFSIHERYSR